ncbi:MAG: sulfatase-like hydrolase/transferase, partial [Verrucomicrobiales bacterium]|nr:sulfatase-like hydrolase/transferase [Verrucomicrobiales bacterium]
RDQPFFIYLPYNTPHSPMQVPDRWWDKYKDRELKMHNRDAEKEDDLHLRCALAMCENIDWNVGRVLKKLDQLDLAEDTIVLYFCDNGPNGVRWNGDMKGKKGSTDEGGVRSPLLVKWPAKIKPGTVVKHSSAAIDLLPTLTGLAGIEAKTAKPLDGMSLAPLLLGEQVRRWPQRTIFSHWRGKTGVKFGNYRLDFQGRLYDLDADPGQRKPIRNRPEILKKLKDEVARFNSEIAAELPEEDQRPFVIGHPDTPLTQVPARDGTAHGNIQRSNKFPNCSYFKNWTGEDDKITWEVEVGQTGDYEVEIYYCVNKKDVGATIQLAYGDESISAKVEQANQQPEKGMENDRFPRAESYVKDFKPMTLGVIRLEKGTGTLTLSAPDIIGKEAMEFRLMMLRRK